VIEQHPFHYFLPQHTQRLIIGSFPCFNGRDYGDWFYSGSGRNEFWRLLGDVFNMPTHTLGDKKNLCERHGIALTDIAYRIERKSNNCADANLRILDINHTGIIACLAAQPRIIYFTSRFVERHFLKHYPQPHCETCVLLSPSPAANRHLASLVEYKQLRATQCINSPYEFRQRKYRQAFLDDSQKC
jgi:hypoxanthine-DNA glycosylase